MTYPVSEAIKNISEGLCNSFAWVFIDKDEAEKFRKRLNMAALRAELIETHTISVSTVVKSDFKTIRHIVLIDERFPNPVEETDTETQTAE